MTEIDLQDRDLMIRWRRDPVLFAEEAFGFTPTTQQRELFQAVGDMAWAKRRAWDVHQAEATGKPHGTSKHGPLTEHELSLKDKFGISVRSGKGPGKTASASIISWWFLVMFADSKVPLLGPTGKQTQDIIWPELGKWFDRRNARGDYCVHPLIRQEVKRDSEKIYRPNDLNDQGYRSGSIIRRKTVAERADTTAMHNVLGGEHADFMMAVVDEAAGVHKDVFFPLENSFTGRCNFGVLIWNPNTTSGFAYDTHFNPTVSEHWVPIHWNAEESTIVSKDHLKRMEDMYRGRDSDQYRIYVMGEPPRSGGDSLIPYVWVQEAVTRELDQSAYDNFPIVAGVDIGHTGDKSVVLIRQGPKVHEVYGFSEIDLHDQVDIIHDKLLQWEVEEAYIDSIGIGAGPLYELRHRGVRIQGVKSSESPRRKEKFPNRRAELWWSAREWFSQGNVDVPDIPALKDQLSSIDYDEHKAKGKVWIESKASMKKRLGGDSPDFADALCISLANPDSLGFEQRQRPKKYQPSWRSGKEPEEASLSQWAL